MGVRKERKMVRFTSPPVRDEFNRKVWEIVRQVPPGKVTTYGFIAGLIPPPGGMEGSDYRAWGARWVGSAMAACPADVPWQRVVNAQGKISLRPGGGGQDQRDLLEAEGIEFSIGNRIDLKKYAWSGPDETWQQGFLPLAQADTEGAS
jgi:methylated-DNA-protein-cysteine methyltransferase related protein